MSYDIIGGGNLNTYETPSFMTIGELIHVCNHNPTLVVKFLETDYTVSSLSSWRGSYDLPSISYESGAKTGKQVAAEIKAELKETHYGYKGGQYKYTANQEFYVANCGSSSEIKVVKAEVEEGVLVLYTKLDPY